MRDTRTDTLTIAHTTANAKNEDDKWKWDKTKRERERNGRAHTMNETSQGTHIELNIKHITTGTQQTIIFFFFYFENVCALKVRDEMKFRCFNKIKWILCEPEIRAHFQRQYIAQHSFIFCMIFVWFLVVFVRVCCVFSFFFWSQQLPLNLFARILIKFYCLFRFFRIKSKSAAAGWTKITIARKPPKHY